MLHRQSYQKEAEILIQPTNTKNSYSQSTIQRYRTEDGHGPKIYPCGHEVYSLLQQREISQNHDIINDLITGLKRFDKGYTEAVQGLRALIENSSGTWLSVNLQAGSNLRNDLVWPAGNVTLRK